MIEPKHITDFEESIEVFHQLERMFENVHAFFEPNIREDAEMLWVVGLVTHMQWFMFSDREKWESISKKYHKLYRALERDGIDLAVFEGRGAYGNYFSHHSALEEGY